MEARALVLGLLATRMRETPNKSANSAYAQSLPAVTAPQAPTIPGLRLAGRATRRRAGMVPGTATATATAMANLRTVRRIHTARRARRPTGATVLAARTVPGLRLAGRAAVRVPEVARTATLLTTAVTIRAAFGGGQRLCRRRRRRPTCKVAGGLVGRQRRRWMLSTLGAPMHFARSVKPLGMMPGLRFLYNFYLIYFV
jgi:hypothetical protein